MSRSRPRRSQLVSAIAVVAALAVPTPANAGPLVANAPSCQSLPVSQVFLPWADVANYELAPGGTLESAADWTLSGGAAVVAGNESYAVNAATDSRSLALPDGSSAVTGITCVGLDHPTLRFFARAAAGNSAVATLRVDVAWEDSAGNDWWTTIGTTSAGATWAPTTQMVITPSLLALLPGSMTPVQFRFVSTGGAFQVDDVYVDPFGGH